MLVLVSFVLVLAAAVTLVVGLLQSGLTLIYLSIACSVLAGVVLAVAVLRGRPEPRPATSGRAFSPPQRAEVPAAVGASSATATTSSWSASPATTAGGTPTPPPPPPSPAPSRAPAASDDAATKAAGTALLGRLRGRKADQGASEPTVVAPSPEPVVEPVAAGAEDASDRTMEIPVAGATEGEDGFPIADYDRLRATELLALLPDFDRNQLEAVRDRESSGKNRFTIMSRIDSLLAAKGEPAWEADDDAWEGSTAADELGADDESALDADLAMDADSEWEVDEDDEVGEVDELVAPGAASEFPISGYDTLTVGQILPRLAELDGDQLAEVREREVQGRNRGTILDRIDRLSARAGARSAGGAMAMPPASPAPEPFPVPAAPVAKARSRKAAAPVSKATAPVSKTTAPAVKKARAPRVAKVAPTPEPVKATTRKAPARKAPAAAAAPTKAPARKTATRKAAAGTVMPAPPAAVPMKEAVKKARATKATKRT